MDRIDTCLMALRRILRASEIHAKELAQAAGLTPVQLRVLQIVAELGAITGSLIARQMHVSPATITALIDKLERAGLVAREPDQTDRRRVAIVTTDQGTAALAQVPDALQQRFAQAFQALAPWEQAMIVANLERVASMMGADDIDTSAVLYPGEL